MSNIPAGTVTFLFTDIEGSTKRWEQYPRQMKAALQRHDSILRAAIEQHNGHVFKTMGDAFCSAFSSPNDAIQAVLDVQYTLHKEPWPQEIGSVAVRAALHTGTPEEWGGDYFGPPVNRVARLLSAGHGGQILLSLATQELVRDVLPTGVELLDMGERRLKDLFRPEHVFQVVTLDLPSQFAPLRTLDARPNNLPVQPTPLIGREKEVREIAATLRRSDVRLLTLTGPGGTGKTRLGLQVAADAVDEFNHGAIFVNLAPIMDTGLVVSTIAQTLGVKEAGGTPLIETLKSYLKEKEILLVLDNCEQIIEAALQVAELLASAPGLKVLATSRIPLRVRGEQEYPVPPLGVPDTRPGHLPLLEKLSQYEAVRLFIERATNVKPDFQVTNENAPAVAEICVRLDGLPLAIELAAARIRLLTPQVMLSRLENRLKLLTGGARDLPARQQTLHAAIEWSHGLLSPDEQKLFRRLAVFVSGRTLEAIEAVCNAEGDLEVDVLDGVESLIAKSLLKQQAGAGGEPRFVMLETIHEYAREKLEESGEGEELRKRHAEHFLARIAKPTVHSLRTMGEEQGNLRAALAWALDIDEMETAFGLGEALAWFCYQSGYNRDGLDILEPLLAKSSELRVSGRALTLMRANQLEHSRGHYERAMAFAEEALALFRELGDSERIGWALVWMARMAMNLGDYERSETLANEMLAIDRELVDKGTRKHISGSFSALLGNMAHMRGDYGQAEAYYEERLQLERQGGDLENLATALLDLGLVANYVGDHRRALELFMEDLGIAQRYGILSDIPYFLMGIAGASIEAPQPESARRAAKLLGAAEAMFQVTGSKLWKHQQIEYDRYMTTARARLDEATWRASQAEGRAMSMEQAIAYATEDADA